MKKSVLITGSGSGIGKSIAAKLAQDGFNIVAHYNRNKAGAEETLKIAEKSGSQGRLLHFDVTDHDVCKEKLINDITANGAYYGVVCNAGIAIDQPFPAMKSDDWDRVIRTNLDGFYNVLNPLTMPMVQARQGGRIVTIASVSGIMGNRGQVNYSAAKAGIIGATKALALELAKRKITVNCVAPGLIETSMVTIEDPTMKEIVKMIPMKRAGKPEEVAGLVSYLFSDAAAYVTRQVISINGGLI